MEHMVTIRQVKKKGYKQNSKESNLENSYLNTTRAPFFYNIVSIAGTPTDIWELRLAGNSEWELIAMQGTAVVMIRNSELSH